MFDINNKVLKRQLKKNKIDSFDDLDKEKFDKFLSLVQKTYEDMDKNFYRLERALEVSTTEFRDLNENLETKVREEVVKNKEKEEKLFSQAKLASMGDMIGNIAHQWRQPLSYISINASGTKLKAELGILKKEEILTQMDQIIDKTIYLSNTIDTFRNFLKDDKEYKVLILQDCINFALNIVSASLKNNFIKLINDTTKYQPIKIKGITSEISEVFINIINNAKDEIISRKIKNAYIKIDLQLLEDKVIIIIEDNAGGIKANIINRIFEPYFTTKHKCQGTGLGLHISYKIVNDSLNGRIYAENNNLGAKFFIELPIF